MITEGTPASVSRQSFPVYPDLIGRLADAHLIRPHARDATVAHVLATCAAYAYADTETLSVIADRLGFGGHHCVRIAQTVDAMYIASCAYVVQSHCGRIVILCYRGTDPGALPTWLGNAEIGPKSHFLSVADRAEKVRVHAGFHLNLRATWCAVIDRLRAAVAGRAIANRDDVNQPLEALYVAGHSLGGAMALLFALKLFGDSTLKPIAERLRAVYTFGQPMALGGPLPAWVQSIEPRVFRHIMANDPVPLLPPSAWGSFAHVGQEFRYTDGQWRQADVPVAQLRNLVQVRRSLLGFVGSERRRQSLRYRLDEHGPHHYLAAMRPKDRITEFGDWED